MSRPTILHIDCNSFYASCEVSLRPELKGKPVVVANYNEAGGGIILALSKEAKALGLKRGNPVFLSLANTYSEQDVAEWYESVKKGLGGDDFDVCCEMKYDGLSISLTYENGRLIRAVTRGDGVQGDDVTENVKTIRSIPLVLTGNAYPQEFEILSSPAER